jgi:hypothetical protein
MYVKELSRKILAELFSGSGVGPRRAPGVRMADFLSEKACALARLHFGRMGAEHPPLPKSAAEIRAVFDPHCSPFDRLRVVLDEAWPKGALLQEKKGVKMPGGKVLSIDSSQERRFRAERFASGTDLLLRSQITALVFGEVPAGNSVSVQITPRVLTSDDYEVLAGGKDGIAPSRVGYTEDWTLSTGDLLLVHGAIPHAVVAQSLSSTQVYICQVGYFADDQPLKLWG